MAQAGGAISDGALSKGANDTRSGGRPLGLRTCVPGGGCSSFGGGGVTSASSVDTRELPPVLPLRAPSAPAVTEPEPEEYPGLGAVG